MSVILLVKDGDMDRYIRPHLSLMDIGHGIGINNRLLTHMKGVAGIGEGLGNSSHVTQHIAEFRVVGSCINVAFREGAVDIQLKSYLNELPLACPVVWLGVIADLALLYDIEQFPLGFEKPFDIQLISHVSLQRAVKTSQAELATFLFVPYLLSRKSYF